MSALRLTAHFALWMIAVPWPACTLWVWAANTTQHMPPQSPADPVARLAVSAFLGLYGAFTCLLITLPLAVLTCLVFACAPQTLRHRASRIGFVAATTLLGLLWARTVGSSLGTAGGNLGLLLIGSAAGLVLGGLTVALWTKGADGPTRQTAAERLGQSRNQPQSSETTGHP
jgi:hypothetical protein